jgi:hypothetical protein
VFDGQPRDMVGDGEVWRPWRRNAIPGEGLKRPPHQGDLKVLIYQSQEADNTFITSDGTSPYNSSR